MNYVKITVEDEAGKVVTHRVYDPDSLSAEQLHEVWVEALYRLSQTQDERH